VLVNSIPHLVVVSQDAMKKAAADWEAAVEGLEAVLAGHWD